MHRCLDAFCKKRTSNFMCRAFVTHFCLLKMTSQLQLMFVLKYAPGRHASDTLAFSTLSMLIHPNQKR